MEEDKKILLFTLLILEVCKKIITPPNQHATNQTNIPKDLYQTILILLPSLLPTFLFTCTSKLIKTSPKSGDDKQSHDIAASIYYAAEVLTNPLLTIKYISNALKKIGLTRLGELQRAINEQLPAIYNTSQWVIFLYFIYTIIGESVCKPLITMAEFTSKQPTTSDILKLAYKLNNLPESSHERPSECDRLAKLISKAKHKELGDSLLQNLKMSVVFHLAKYAFEHGHAELLIVIIDAIGSAYFAKDKDVVLPLHIKKIVGKRILTATLNPIWQLQKAAENTTAHNKKEWDEAIDLLKEIEDKKPGEQIEIIINTIDQYPRVLTKKLADSIAYYNPILMCLIINKITSGEADTCYKIYKKTSMNARKYTIITYPQILDYLLNPGQRNDPTQQSTPSKHSLNNLINIIFDLNPHDQQKLICSNPMVISSLLSQRLDKNRESNCLKLIAHVLGLMPKTPEYVTMFKNELSENADLIELLKNTKFKSYKKSYGMLGCLELKFAEQLSSDQEIHTENQLLLQEYVNERKKEITAVDARRTQQAKTTPLRNPPKETEQQEKAVAAEADTKKSCHEFINHTSTLLANLEKILQKPNTNCFEKLQLELETTIEEIEQNPDLLAETRVELKDMLRKNFLSLWKNHDCSDKTKKAPAGENIRTLQEIKIRIENLSDYIPDASTTADGSIFFTDYKSTQGATDSTQTPQPTR